MATEEGRRMGMRRTVVLSALAAVAVIVVSGAMLLWMGNPAHSQGLCVQFCLDKTATPSTVEVGEQITFTVTEVAPSGCSSCIPDRPLVDDLPSQVRIDSVEAIQSYGNRASVPCSTSENTVTCSSSRGFIRNSTVTLTIKATPTECGTFTNTAHNGFDTAEASFTVVGCDTRPPRVISTVPAGGASGVAPSANIMANFSEDMNASTINGTTFKLFKKGSTTRVGASVNYNATLDRAILHPNNSLQRGVSYRAVVTTGAKDKAGNRLDQNRSLSGLQQKIWFFKVSN